MRDVEPMPGCCWSSFVDDGPTSTRQWFNVSRLPGWSDFLGAWSSIQFFNANPFFTPGICSILRKTIVNASGLNEMGLIYSVGMPTGELRGDCRYSTIHGPGFGGNMKHSRVFWPALRCCVITLHNPGRSRCCASRSRSAFMYYRPSGCRIYVCGRRRIEYPHSGHVHLTNKLRQV